MAGAPWKEGGRERGERGRKRVVWPKGVGENLVACRCAKYARKREARSLSAGEGRATIRWQREGACGREQPRGAAQGLRFE